VLSDFVQPETRRWHTVPRGTQVCDHVTFICDGAIRTAGVGGARDGNHYPGAVLGVPVNKRGARIHLLQAAENSEGMTEGAPYGRLVLHYENGETRQLELLFGIHGEDWLAKGNGRDPVADPNTRPAWVQKRSGDGMFIRLYHTALENPLPEYGITSVDFISPLREANLLLFALTIDDDPRPLAPSYGPGETLVDPGIERIVFSLHDSTGHPARGARLAWTVRGSRLRIDFPPFAANAEGEVIVEAPRRYVRQILYKASASDGSEASGTLNLRGLANTNVQLELESSEH